MSSERRMHFVEVCGWILRMDSADGFCGFRALYIFAGLGRIRPCLFTFVYTQRAGPFPVRSQRFTYVLNSGLSGYRLKYTVSQISLVFAVATAVATSLEHEFSPVNNES